MLNLKPIKARLEAATAGEWKQEHNYEIREKGRRRIIEAWGEGPLQVGNNMEDVIPQAINDATFITHAHNVDIPTLVAEVERLRQKLEIIKDLARSSLPSSEMGDESECDVAKRRIIEIAYTAAKALGEYN